MNRVNIKRTATTNQTAERINVRPVRMNEHQNQRTNGENK